MQIALWFLILSLFLPRLTLLCAYFWGGMPAHVGIPFPICVIGSIFLARPLILVFIAMNMGISNPWFILHAIFMVLMLIKRGLKELFPCTVEFKHK